MMNHCQCASDYPRVTAGCDDARTLAMMQADFASASSEMTAVSQYLFNELILAECSPEVSHSFEEISLTEMRHLELFGEAIVALGGTPCYASRGRFWSGKDISYFRTAREALCGAIAAEKEAVATYSEQAGCTGNSSVAALLKRIIEDECDHIRIFENLLNNCGR